MTSKRVRLLCVAVVVSLLALSGTMMVASPRASAAEGECPPGYGPIGPATDPDFFDQNVAVFAGGDFAIGGTAAESEGILVALGNASFQRSSPGFYNVGVVGQGSGVAPNPGTDMLVVGGTMSGNVQTTVQVGFGIGGNVVVGGPIAVGTVVDTGGPPKGTITQNAGPAATAPYSELPAQISAKSAEIAALPATGTVLTTGFSQTFTGDGTSNPQVFTITGAPGPARTLQFKNIPDGAAVYINVTAAVAELEYNTLLDENGAAMPTNSPDFPPIATHTLWNFPAATNLALDGFAQLPGSILVPNPASSVVNSMPGTNGRMYVNGDLLHTGSGSEMHNYPFLPDDELGCLALIGGFTVQKIVNDPDGVVDPGLVFSGTYTCDLAGTDVTPVDNTWSATAGAGPTTVSASVPVDSVCTLTETPPADPDPNHVWEPAQISPSSVTITGEATPVGFTVTNTVTNVVTQVPSGFTVEKTVVDPDGLVNPATVYGGTFSCTLAGNDVTPAPNTWSTTAGAGPVLVTDQVPLGSVCTLVEAPPVAPDGNHVWQPAAISPASVTITDDTTPVGFTVANTLAELPGGFTVAKALVDPDGLVNPATVYSGTFSCTLAGSDVTPVPNTWSTTAGAGPVVVTSTVPLGSVCTLVETPPSSPDGNHAWQPADITPASVTITNADTSVGFTVTNTLVELPGGFTVAKTVVDPDGVVAPGLAFTGTFSCTLAGTDVTPVPNTWSTTAGAGPVVVTDQVPLGSVCTISETPPISPDGNHAWQPADIAPASVTITNADTNVGFTVTNTLVELPGGFTVAKTVVDPDGLVDPSTVYSGTFSCTLGGTDVTPVPNTWSTTAGAAPVIVTDQVPLGSVCTLVETPPVAPDGNHVWQPAAISPASVTISNADTSVGFTVTNTLAELPGGFTVQKTVVDPDGVVGPGLTFTGTFTCTLGATDVTPAPNTWSTTAGAGPVVVTDQVPLGSVCTLSENPPTAPDGNHAWQPADITPASVTITNADTSVGFTVTNTLAELPGGFTVQKTVVDPDGVVNASTVYSGTYSCTLAGVPVGNGSWSTTAGVGPVVVTDQLPLGSICALVETPPTAPDGNHVWQPAEISPASVTISNADTSVGFTVTNTLAELPGGFTVQKAVVDPDGVVDPSTVYSGTFSCSLAGADVTPVPNTWSTTAGAGPVVVTDQVPLGSVCTISETPPTAPDGNHVWQPAAISPASVTISNADTTVGFTVTNTLAELPGGFTVQKTVVDPDGVVAPGLVFTGTFSCTLAGTDVTPAPNTWSTTAGAGPVVVTSAVPLGSVCTLVETPPSSPDGNHAWQPADITPASVTITNADTSVGFTVTNTLVELPGGFTVAKTVVDPDGVVAPGLAFTGTFSCTLAGTDVTPVPNTWSATAGAGPVVVTDQVPLGSVCTISETPPVAPDGNHAWQPADITPASVTITNADTSVGFTVTNTLAELPGGFTVQKTVVDPNGVVDPSTVYAGTFTCTLDGTDVTPADNTWSTTAGAAPVIVTDQVPLGSVCTLVETPPVPPDGNHEWEPVQITPASVTITNADTSVGFTVTNTLAELPGGFTVAKTVVDPDGVVAPATVFSGTFSCTLGGTDVTPVPNTWSTTAGAGPVVVTDQVPLGSVCTISETSPVAPDGNHVWQPAAISPASVTISNADTSVGFTVTNTLAEVPGGFTVQKTVVDPDGVVAPGLAFTGTFSCTLAGSDVTPVPNTWSTTAGAGPVVVTDQVPLGSVCALVETPPVAPDGNHAWQPADITPASVTITDADTSVGFTVTNTLAELPGGFTVAKTVVDPDGVVAPATVYSGTFSCILGGTDVTPLPNTWSTTAGAGPVVVTDQVPLGSVCTLEETAPLPPDEDHEWRTPVITPDTVTISNADTSVGFTISNTLVDIVVGEPGDGIFAIDKVVVDPDGLVDPGLVYAGTFSCTLGGLDVTPDDNVWSITAEAPPVVVSEIPLGSVCTLVETPPAAPDDNHVWQPAEISPASVTISEDDTNVEFTVTNTLAELPGGFTVDKVVDDPDGVVDPTLHYTGTYSCMLDGTDVTPVNNTWSTTSGAAPAIVTDALPLGSVCTLVEDPPAAPDATHSWQAAQITPASVTITNADTSVGFTVTNAVDAVSAAPIDTTAVDASGAVIEPHPSATTPGGPKGTGKGGTGADLASTGPSSALRWLVWIGLLAVLGGVALAWPARRARRRDVS